MIRTDRISMEVKKKIFFLVMVSWTILWIIFLIREDKDGQYSLLFKAYTVPVAERIKVVYGSELYGSVLFCKENMPGSPTYRIYGFEKHSIDEVRMRYLLWPAKAVSEAFPQYKIIFGGGLVDEKGYTRINMPDRKGYLLKRCE